MSPLVLHASTSSVGLSAQQVQFSSLSAATPIGYNISSSYMSLFQKGKGYQLFLSPLQWQFWVKNGLILGYFMPKVGTRWMLKRNMANRQTHFRKHYNSIDHLVNIQALMEIILLKGLHIIDLHSIGKLLILCSVNVFGNKLRKLRNLMNIFLQILKTVRGWYATCIWEMDFHIFSFVPLGLNTEATSTHSLWFMQWWIWNKWSTSFKTLRQWRSYH